MFGRSVNTMLQNVLVQNEMITASKNSIKFLTLQNSLKMSQISEIWMGTSGWLLQDSQKTSNFILFFYLLKEMN